MALPLLNDVVILFSVSILVLYLCHRLKIPSVVGLLLTGVLAGPGSFGLVTARHEIEMLAEIGVILLLFTIGIEFSLRKLLTIKRTVFIGGGSQVLLTIVIVIAIASWYGVSYGEAVFWGFLVSLSSTAILLKTLQARGEMDTLQGGVCLAILIFQDIVAVPMMLFTPMLAGGGDSLLSTLFYLILKKVGIVVAILVSAKWILPHLLFQIAKTRIRELFLMGILTICLGIVWVTSSLGLSAALGAFLAGLIISESEYNQQALSIILPFRDVFTSLFFVSIGMLFEVNQIVTHPLLILLLVVGSIGLKTVISTTVSLVLGYSLRTSILVGLSLAQIGEFSFILSKNGLQFGFLAGEYYQLFLAVSIITMGLTPFIVALSPKIADALLRIPSLKRLQLKGKERDIAAESIKLSGHIIIIGFGLNGRNVAHAAKAASIPYVTLEMNPETVRREKKKGHNIFFGDGTEESVLRHLRLLEARVAVIAINDPTATRRITELMRKLNPKLHIIVRTRFLLELKPLYDLGANEVIPEEFETSVEIFTRVLMKYLVPRDKIETLVQEMRSHGYEVFRSLSRDTASFCDFRFHIPDSEISALRIDKSSPLCQKTLIEVQLRTKYEVNALAVRRGGGVFSNPDGNTLLEAEDVLIVFGPSEKIAVLADILTGTLPDKPLSLS